MHLVPAETCRAQIVSVLTAWGMDPATVATTAEVMIETDLAGVDSHGISMLMDYDESRRKGKINLQARPRILRETPVTALVDADAGLGHPASVFGMRLAIAKAKSAGVGVVAVRNSHHFGAAGYYAALAPAEGLVGMVTSATRTIGVVPTRGAVPVLGTNPIAFAAPIPGRPAAVVDLALSKVARGNIVAAKQKGRPIPEGWALDSQGRPTTDAKAALSGAMLAMGGTKGALLALVVELLCCALTGAAFGFEADSFFEDEGNRPRLGQALLVVDLGALAAA